MSDNHDFKRIGGHDECRRIGASKPVEALPSHEEEAPKYVPPEEPPATTSRHGILGAGAAAILTLVTIIVAGLLLIATHGGRTEYESSSLAGSNMTGGPKAGYPDRSDMTRIAAIFATSPEAAAKAVGGAKGQASASGNIPVVVYLFNYDSDNVPENAALTRLAADLKQSGRDVAIVAYSDPKGSQAYNQRLSERRANAIGRYLEKHGVDRSNISTKGGGSMNTYSEYNLDRRAVITPQ
ncbi:MAG: OmpA family protein [Candidatus Amulumruptor sp.]|nr:OmpA family protein [Candidatus Amulumruptor sp.]